MIYLFEHRCELQAAESNGWQEVSRFRVPDQITGAGEGERWVTGPSDAEREDNTGKA